MKKKEQWQIKKYFKMPNGKVFYCIYQKALRKLESGRYGKGKLQEITKKKE